MHAVGGISSLKALAWACLAPLVVGFATVGSGAMPAGAAAATSTPGVTGNTITIGFVTSETGPAAPTFSDSGDGALARFAVQNAHGGIDGRKLKLVVKDDQSSPTTAGNVASELGGSNVFGVIEDSAIDEDYESGDHVLAGLHVPVTTWGSNTVDSNVFDAFEANVPGNGAPLQGVYPLYNYVGPFMKSLGVTKLAGITYSSIAQSMNEFLSASTKDGISACYRDVQVPIGSVNFTTDALSIQHAGCNGVVTSAVDSTDVGVANALENEGSHAKQLYFTGYDQQVLDQPLSLHALNGAYFSTEFDFVKPNAATKAMLAGLKKYDPSYKGGIPDLGTLFAYVSADLMIKGLQLAGANPTRASFISNLRQLTSYNAGGLLPDTLTYANFGTLAGLAPSECFYYVQLRSGKFYDAHKGKPLCAPLQKLSAP
ncbi:MAG TPA: ABC transporter substrate-binding protein [Acidimicrobiales bacterium]|jgi:branched-chain amino acid transport system substrate-binding protein